MTKHNTIRILMAGILFASVAVTARGAGNNDVQLQHVAAPAFVETGKPFEVQVSFMNRGVMYAQTLDITCAMEGEAPQTFSAPVSPALGMGMSGTVTVSGISCSSDGVDLPLTVTISKVNGAKDDNPADNSATVKLTALEKTYPQAVVIEEWTGTWCKWCVRGIVGMQYMREHYEKDGFIGIAVHARSDAMVSPSLSGFVDKYAKSFPGCIANRKIQDNQADKASMESLYNQLKISPSLAEIVLDAWYTADNPDEIHLESTSTFALGSNDSLYRLAFVLLEDHVGPYQQANAYANGTILMDGWEKKGDYVQWYFNEVAREANQWDGIPGSLPAVIEKFIPYRYECKISAANISDLNRCDAVAMILNRNTGEIVNACKVKVHEGEPERETTGVGINGNDNVAVTVNAGALEIAGPVAEYRVYATDGRIVANGKSPKEIVLPKGIYLVETKDIESRTSVTKIMIR